MKTPLEKYYIYDVECYPNVFTKALKHHVTGQTKVYEWSARRDDMPEMINFIRSAGAAGCSMVGFNNLGYDYLLLHYICMNYHAGITVNDVFHHSNRIINASKDEKFRMMIWDRDRLARQIDLYKICHFDNKARSTGLKILEFNMRAGHIQELPYKPGTPLNSRQIDKLIDYNLNRDVENTERFFMHCLPAIEMRDELSEKFGKDFTNHNDTKIGKDYFIMRLGKHTCWDYSSGSRKPRQTVRPEIALGDVVLPYITYEQPEFNRILEWFKNRVITETKDSIKDLYCIVDGFRFDFGTGGIHGSIDSSVVHSDTENVIIDVDVASYYPNLAIVNNLYPEHLGELFCNIYKDMYLQRKKYPKGTPENAVFKLALNGAYGDSNSVYSPFYDPKFTMSITINGQLLLCMLAEQMMKTPGLQVIQINTDGLTFRVPREHVEHTRRICDWWESVTGLELEEAMYSSMFIKDVNNYVAVYESGKKKRKGKYEYELQWYRNHSALVIPMAANAFFLEGIEPANFLQEHDDFMDFMLRTKVPRSSRLELDGQQIQNVSRYYISKTGGPLIKVMPPLKKNPEKERPIGINVGWEVTECNEISKADPSNINYQFYEQEVEKLIDFAR